MNYRELIARSEAHLSKNPGCMSNGISFKVFSTGAQWMSDKLNELDGRKPAFNDAVNFGLYGVLKYGICLSAFFISAIALLKYSIFLTPLSVIVFYLCEVHFLFLFPLLIDGVKNPVWESIKRTYKTGLVKCLLTVMPIAGFMLVGLFHPNDPLRNWHIGSLSIIIWYRHEIGNRL